MKKIVYTLILALLVVSGCMFANRENKNETSSKSTPKPLTIAEKKAAMEEWEATPEGISFREWESSAAGKKVDEASSKIRKSVRAYSNLEGVVSSLSLPPNARLGFGLMVKIQGEEYILTFGPEKVIKNNPSLDNGFEKLQGLKVNDKITIRSQTIFKSPNYSYPIISADYVAQGSKVIYKRVRNQGAC